MGGRIPRGEKRVSALVCRKCALKLGEGAHRRLMECMEKIPQEERWVPQNRNERRRENVSDSRE